MQEVEHLPQIGIDKEVYKLKLTNEYFVYSKEGNFYTRKLYNIITGEKFEIRGRGTVFICENCTHDPGDTFLYQGKNYFIKGVELQGYEEKPYKKAGLLVVEVKEGDKTTSDKFTIEEVLKETGGKYLSPHNTTKYMEKKERIEKYTKEYLSKELAKYSDVKLGYNTSEDIEKYLENNIKNSTDVFIENLDQYLTSIKKEKQKLEELILTWRVKLRNRKVLLEKSPDWDDGYEEDVLINMISKYDKHFGIETKTQGET